MLFVEQPLAFSGSAKGHTLLVFLTVGLSSLGVGFYPPLNWLLAHRSHDRIKPIAAHSKSDLKQRVYTKYMLSHKLSTGSF